MKFSRLRIHGFKTFVEPTDFLIEPGLTGVVGPNGCGKSNLVEALRWVMGENSFKNMRASGMDDVIFSGSGNRPARNTAEVMLTVDNGRRLAPAQFNDHDVLEVSRRIEREAGSVYKVNGREVRARDVQLLFADASTGARSPALVRQGQIGEIISAKPQARRRILEEAAGIAGLHARRHEAETRLKAAETNLDRLETVLTQIETQLDGLKRQARQAVRYRGLSADIRKAEATLAYLKFREAGDLVREAERLVEEETRLVAARTTARRKLPRTRRSPPMRCRPARRRGQGRRGAAPARRRPRAAGGRGEARPRAHRRTRPPHRPARRRHRPRKGPRRRCRRRHRPPRGRGGGACRCRRGRQGRRGRRRCPRHRGRGGARRHREVLSEATSALAEITARRNQLERTIRDAGERLMRLEGQRAEIDAETARLEAGSDHAAVSRP